MTHAGPMSSSPPPATPLHAITVNLLLAFLTTAGLFYVDIMPALVAGLQDGRGFSPAQAGFVASANVLGSALGGLVAVFTVKRLAWRRVALLALVVLIAFDLVSMRVTSADALLVLRFAHGLVGGLLVGTGYSLIARTPSADRAFGMLFLLQFSLGGLMVAILPNLVMSWGVGALFLTLIAFSAVTIAILPFIPDLPARSGAAPIADAGGVARPWHRIPWFYAALLAVLLFQAANMGLLAFAIGLGKAFGHTIGFTSRALGVAQWTAIVGPLLVIAIGTRFGRLWPLLIAGVLSAVAKIAFLYAGENPVVFVCAAIVAAVTIAVILSYLLGMCAHFDPSGQTATLGGFCGKLGIAAGPATGALLLQASGFRSLIVASLIVMALAVVVALWPAMRLDRASSSRRPPGDARNTRLATSAGADTI